MKIRTTRIMILPAAVIASAVAADAVAVQPGAVAVQARADTLRLTEAVAEAVSVNPMLRAARLRSEAARARVSRAGVLPDPSLSFSLKNRPLNGFGTGERMTLNSIQLRQTLPWPGKLRFAEEREHHVAEATELTALESEVELVARLKSVYYEIAYMDRSLAIMLDTRDLLREFLVVATTLYAVGQGLQADVLQAQISVAGLSEDITVVEQRRLAMAARMNAVLGRGRAVAVPALELPAPAGTLPSLDALMARARESRPALLASRELVSAAESGYRAARRALFPDLTLGAEYSERPEFADMVSLSVGITIPLWAGSRQLPMREEAGALRAMREASLLDLLNETYARLAEARAEAHRALSLSSLYSTSIMPQARAAVESSLSAYRVGEVDFMTLVQNELTVNRYEIETVRLAAAYHAALADIEALVGGDLEEIR